MPLTYGELAARWNGVVSPEPTEAPDERDAEIARLRAENDRLREALANVGRAGRGLDINSTDEERASYWQIVAETGRRIARAALANTP